MIAHLVIWTWQPTVTPDQVDHLVRKLREITVEMPSLHRYECGPALGLRQGGDFGVVAVVGDAHRRRHPSPPTPPNAPPANQAHAWPDAGWTPPWNTPSRPWSPPLFDQAETRDRQHRRRWVVLVDGANHQLDCLQREAERRGVHIDTVAVSAIDSSGNRSPRSEPLLFTTAPYTHLPQCSITLEPNGNHYKLTVQVYNTTAAALDRWAVTFRMPVAHTLTSPRLARDDADAVLSSEPGSSLPSGTEAMFWSFVSQNGDATLPGDFAISGEPCTVRQT